MPRKREMWTTSQVAEYLGIVNNSVRAQMHRWGIPVLHRAVGRNGENMYDAAAVRAKAAARPRKPKEQQ